MHQHKRLGQEAKSSSSWKFSCVGTAKEHESCPPCGCTSQRVNEASPPPPALTAPQHLQATGSDQMLEVRTSWSHSFPINKSAAHQDLPGFARKQPGTHVGWLCKHCRPPPWDLASGHSQGPLSGPWPGSLGTFRRAAEDPGLVCTLQAKHARTFLL